MKHEPIRPVREFIGSLADLGTLLPLTVGLIACNGVRPGPALVLLGITYILTGTYYRLPVPVQPLKAMATIAIATGASVGEIRAGALWMSGLMIALAVSGLAQKLNAVFPRVLIRGLQLGIGLMMIRAGAKLALAWGDSLGTVVIGAHGVSATPGSLGLAPSGAEFWRALPLLVIPQLPLTVGNAVLATRDCALSYFGPAGERVTPRRLAATIGLANLAAGLTGGVPVCHGAGGMTAHYSLGARTGLACAMIGSALLVTGIAAGGSMASALAAMPAWVLGVLLAYVGVRHAALARDAFGNATDASTVLLVGVVGLTSGNLMAALGIGLALRLMLRIPAARGVKQRFVDRSR